MSGSHVVHRSLAGALALSALAASVAVRADPPDANAAPAPTNGVETGATRHRQILFTFDDGPDVRTTRDLLRRLAKRSVRGVFFVVSRKIEARSGAASERAVIAREVAAAGHLIASHAYEHIRLDRLPASELRTMLERDDAIHERVLGRRPRIFRPPHGMASAALISLSQERGRILFNWNLNPRDYSERDPVRILRNFVSQLAYRERTSGDRGGVVLLHDTHPWSLDAFERIHDWILAQNCRLFSTPSEELWDILDDPGYLVPSLAAGPLDPIATRQARIRAATAARCGPQ